MTDDEKRFQKILQHKTAQEKESIPQNPYWGMKDGKIFDLANNVEFSPYSRSWDLIKVIKSYFKETYNALHTEVQVLILNDADYQKIRYLTLPQLTLPHPWNTVVRCVIPPQMNTEASTVIPEQWWYQHITKNNIYPLMRVHSHHVLPAYQSKVDRTSLNSGTLEIVLGKIYDEIPEIEYWLDIKGTDNKLKTFHKP